MEELSCETTFNLENSCVCMSIVIEHSCTKIGHCGLPLRSEKRIDWIEQYQKLICVNHASREESRLSKRYL